jgi:hypothetical protein
MPEDSYTEVTKDSWSVRLEEFMRLGAGAFLPYRRRLPPRGLGRSYRKSFAGLFFGIALLLAAFPLLFWNEGRPLRSARSLEEGARIVVSASADKVDSANEGKLVHMTGKATTTETLWDREFGVSAQAIKLERKVEMYQWKEESGEGGWAHYDKVWSPDFIGSDAFKHPAGHRNPQSMPVSSYAWTAKKVTLGAFTLSQAQVGMLDAGPVTVAEMTAGASSPAIGGRFRLYQRGYCSGEDPDTPAIGDVKVEFPAVRPATVSILGRQMGSTFGPYRAKAGDSILLLRYGTVRADSMFKAAPQPDVIDTWLPRLLGFLMMTFGLTMALKPPRGIVVDFVPSMVISDGAVENAAVGILAAALAACLSLAAIAAAWLAWRPHLAITLLLLAGGGIAALAYCLPRQEKQKTP